MDGRPVCMIDEEYPIDGTCRALFTDVPPPWTSDSRTVDSQRTRMLSLGRMESLNIHVNHRLTPFLNFADRFCFIDHAWKYRFAAAGLSQIVQHIFGMKSHDYASLLDLDRNLRRIQLPGSLQSPTSFDGEPANGKSWSTCPQTALMQFAAICTKESGE